MEKKLVLENYPTLGDFIVAVFLAGRTLQCKKDSTGWHEVKHYGTINLNTFYPANEIKGEWRAKPEKRAVEGWILVKIAPHVYGAALPFTLPNREIYRTKEDAQAMQITDQRIVAKITFEVEE